MVVKPLATDVAGVTIKPAPTFDWLNVAPVYEPLDDTDTASLPNTPAKLWLPVTLIVAAVVES